MYLYTTNGLTIYFDESFKYSSFLLNNYHKYAIAILKYFTVNVNAPDVIKYYDISSFFPFHRYFLLTVVTAVSRLSVTPRWPFINC